MYPSSLELKFYFLSLEDVKAEWLTHAEKVRSKLQHQLNDAHEKLSETQMALRETQTSLTETQRRLEDLQRSREEEIKSLEKELKQALADRDAAARESTFTLFIQRDFECNDLKRK